MPSAKLLADVEAGRFIKVSTLADAVNLSTHTVYRKIRQQSIASVDFAGTVRVPPGEVARLLGLPPPPDSAKTMPPAGKRRGRPRKAAASLQPAE